MFGTVLEKRDECAVWGCGKLMFFLPSGTFDLCPLRNPPTPFPLFRCMHAIVLRRTHRTNPARFPYRLYRDVRAYAIPGGSEEIMLDLSIRQALRVHKVLGMKL